LSIGNRTIWRDQSSAAEAIVQTRTWISCKKCNSKRPMLSIPPTPSMQRQWETAHSASSSKSSSLSRYFMMFRLILEESTQVTKSSMFLYCVSLTMKVRSLARHSPGDEICGVCHNVCSYSDVTLLDHLDSTLDVVCHAQPSHDDRQPSPSES
jgi:Pyruvate/2-oxoacid:ferredoxin oxidoreductase delta subunit